MDRFFLGVDGGQSSTTAVIGDAEGRIVGWATGGPCNHVGAHEGRAKFLRVVGECIAQAAARAGIENAPPSFEAACLGMSGGPEDKSALLAELIQTEHLQVTHDARIALAGALNGEPGAIVIAGTGSIAYGENAQGETSRVGGWGYIFGDEGGAFDIVRQALRAALREHEGWGPRTPLTPALMEATGTSTANEALHLFYTEAWPRSRVAALAPLVDAAAEAADPTAREILTSAAQHLAMLIASVRRQLWKDDEPCRVSWIGGVLQSGIVLERLRMILAIDGGLTAAAPEHSPAVGALLLAWRARGLKHAPARYTFRK